MNFIKWFTNVLTNKTPSVLGTRGFAYSFINIWMKIWLKIKKWLCEGIKVEKIEINGKIIEYNLERKKIKNSYISISNWR